MKMEEDKTSYKVKDGLKYIYCHNCGKKKEVVNKSSLCIKCAKDRNISLEKHRSGKKDTTLI